MAPRAQVYGMRVGRPGEGLEKSSRLYFLLFLKDPIGHLANLCFINEDTSQKKPGDRTRTAGFPDNRWCRPRDQIFAISDSERMAS